MRKDVILMVLGGLVFVSPLLAIPRNLKDPAIFVLGALTFIIALLYRIETRRRERRRESVAHVENNPDAPVGMEPESSI